MNGLEIINAPLFDKLFKRQGIIKAAQKVASRIDSILDLKSLDIIDKLRSFTKDPAIKESWHSIKLDNSDIKIYNSHSDAELSEFGDVNRIPEAPVRKTLLDDPLDKQALTKKILDIFKGEI
jgi:hypothetical protein